MDLDQRITNISFNTKAGVEGEIRRQERMHPFWGLRQAEEFIRDRSAALEETSMQLRQMNRQEALLTAKIEDLQGIDADKRTAEDHCNLDEWMDQITRIKTQKMVLSPMIRDCLMELETARAEKARILDAHPNLNQSYDVLQASISKEALMAKEATFIAGRVLAARQGLPESVAEILVLSAPEEREQLMRRVTELLDSSQVQLTMYQLALHLSEYSDRDRALLLEQSAALLHQYHQRQLESQHGLEKD